ncbi:hypothetical protein F4809DRAFT_453196 [Biscogniauxia mediterranea]|nr:hypothetical protein F4809DRAFT_453196 [Biscogniauxia mediterranea]
MPTNGLVAHGAPPLPRYVLYLEAAIILLSIIILALAAYGISLYGNGEYYYSSGVPGFLIFVVILTWIVYGGSFVFSRVAPRLYFRIIVIAGHILSLIFWLTGWAWAASSAAYVLSFDKYHGSDSVGGPWKTFGSVMGACAGLGALEWILCIIALVVLTRACLRNPDSNSTSVVELNHAQKHRADAPGQGYTSQPVYGAQHPPV